ncbi:hypothetical protein FHR24_001772 [Wenyingzhuangia heitensis]|uniref:Uncharacterized protein n=1 Tax=Wenyingzhuangia heitensis TaxID=1487859 RepID=A0ABX0U8Z0_9FLAO|nr:hypothetical protein [Wenyingzhuangia heitensis]NIJ45304.1 hypothetical protein [Wenyingzhuangia heitensis]
MHSTEQIKQLVQQNIHQIKISEFVAEGGWPNINEIDVSVFNQTEQNGVEVINLHILYTVDKAGCCFIPGAEQQMRLPKRITIQNNKVKIGEDE